MLVAMSMLVYRNRGIRGVASVILKFLAVTAVIIGLAAGLRSLYDHASHGLSYPVFILLALAILFFIIRRSIRKKAQMFNGLLKFIDAIPSLLLLVIVIGGIVAGYFTATEASAVAVLYALILSFIYGEISVTDLPQIILRSVRTTAIVLLLVGTSIGLSWIMSYENIPQNVSEGLLNISSNPFIILLIINLILLFVGTFMDMTPAVLIFTPIFLPIVTAQMGMDPIHFGIIMVLNLSVGLCTPPVGSVLFHRLQCGGHQDRKGDQTAPPTVCRYDRRAPAGNLHPRTQPLASAPSRKINRLRERKRRVTHPGPGREMYAM